MAVDTSGNAFTWNGTSWSGPEDVDGSNAQQWVANPNNGEFGFFVSCSSSTFCMGVDDSGHILAWNGKYWSGPSDVDGTNSIDSISCPASSFCMAVDESGNALTFK